MIRGTKREKAALVGCAIVMLLSIQFSAASANGVSLVINEVMASNGATRPDPQGQYDDWIEVYNAGDVPVDLGGMYLTDDLDRPTKWQVPTTNATLTTIAPRGYLLIWADGDTKDPGLHADFKLDAGGEDLGLFGTDGATVIDVASFPELAGDISYGRYPDANDT
ncbi:MAG: lamin tail domain-containing protein, partial [Planctomycetaceae bacterium]